MVLPLIFASFFAHVETKPLAIQAYNDNAVIFNFLQDIAVFSNFFLQYYGLWSTTLWMSPALNDHMIKQSCFYSTAVSNNFNLLEESERFKSPREKLVSIWPGAELKRFEIAGGSSCWGFEL